MFRSAAGPCKASPKVCWNCAGKNSGCRVSGAALLTSEGLTGELFRSREGAWSSKDEKIRVDELLK